MDMSLVVGLLLLAVMVGSVLLTTLADARARSSKRRNAHNQQITGELFSLDAVLEGIGRLDLPTAYRSLLRSERERLLQAIPDVATPAEPPALNTRNAMHVAESPQQLANILSELQAARRHLRDLERAGAVSARDRTQMVQDLTRLSALIRAESLELWAQAADVEPNIADSYLRDAQEALSKSLHLDAQFAQRIVALKERQEQLNAERVRRARISAEVAQIKEAEARAKLAHAQDGSIRTGFDAR